MSVSYCYFCDNYVDEDYNVEHFELCNIPEDHEVIAHNYEGRITQKDDLYFYQNSSNPEKITLLDKNLLEDKDLFNALYDIKKYFVTVNVGDNDHNDFRPITEIVNLEV